MVTFQGPVTSGPSGRTSLDSGSGRTVLLLGGDYGAERVQFQVLRRLGIVELDLRHTEGRAGCSRGDWVGATVGSKGNLYVALLEWERFVDRHQAQPGARVHLKLPPVARGVRVVYLPAVYERPRGRPCDRLVGVEVVVDRDRRANNKGVECVEREEDARRVVGRDDVPHGWYGRPDATGRTVYRCAGVAFGHMASESVEVKGH